MKTREYATKHAVLLWQVDSQNAATWERGDEGTT